MQSLWPTQTDGLHRSNSTPTSVRSERIWCYLIRQSFFSQNLLRMSVQVSETRWRSVPRLWRVLCRMCFDRRLQSLPHWMGRPSREASWPEKHQVSSSSEHRIRNSHALTGLILTVQIGSKDISRCLGCADRCSSCNKAGPAKCDRCGCLNLAAGKSSRVPCLRLQTRFPRVPAQLRGEHCRDEARLVLAASCCSAEGDLRETSELLSLGFSQKVGVRATRSPY